MPPDIRIRTIELDQPLRWIALAWKDFERAPWLGLAHGAVLAAFGALLLAVAHHRFWLLAGAFSGFLVVAPVLATSLYAMSRAMERGDRVDLRLLLRTWTSWQKSRLSDPGGYWCLVRFGLLLALAGTGWVLTSAALITLFAPAPVNTPRDFIIHVLMAPDHWLFEAWLVLGGVLVAPIFASSVITMPLMLDRRINMTNSILASWQAVIANPVPLALWAGLLMSFTLLGLASALIGLVLVVPLLGHASWHAYRDLVDASALPTREEVDRASRGGWK